MLFYAARCKKAECIEMALRYMPMCVLDEPHINVTDYSLHTPLMVSADAGMIQNFNIFLKKGANLFAKDYNKCTVLFHAARGGNVSLIKALIQMGLHINERNRLGQRPVFYALERDRNIAAVDCFLEHGAELDCCDHQGMNPLMWASKHGASICVSRLLELLPYECLEKKNHQGETALNVAKRGTAVPTLLKLASKHGKRNSKRCVSTLDH